MGTILDRYGELVFGRKEMENRLSASVYEKLRSAIEQGEPLDQSIAEDVARAMKEWALENGATHFTHWFQPQRSGTAEKHDSFVSYGDNGDVVETFSAKQLIQSEPDASSFPSGGIRSTFEARGYTAWDPNSPAFIRDEANGRSLVIPSIYLSWTGEALDMKTQLLRSLNTLNTHAIRLQRELGNRNARRITVVSGLEQEYFLIPKDLGVERPDILICGRTLFGAPAAKGQLMEDHYFGAIQTSVMSFMNDLDRELYRYGIPVKTKHNEVAPNQFELAPLHEEINLAIDHNLLTMDIMRRVAADHDFIVLHHEKPFAGLNGSGKHMNWSLGDNTGTNYLEPSKSPLKNISFLMTLGAILLGVHKHSGLLRAAIADAGNEHRLGSHEAPPAILSVYLGDYLTEILDHIEGLKKLSEKDMNYINLGIQNMPKVVKDISDRNRTSPIAFTGNKFEFRAVGGATNCSDAATAMNMVCAYGYRTILERLAKMKGSVKENCILVLKDILKETKAVRFEGNGYSAEWRKEAKRRGLYMVDNTPEAITYYTSKDCIQLFESLGVLSQRELESRSEVKLEAYCKTKAIEIRVGLDMVTTRILPALLNQLSLLGSAAQASLAAGKLSAALKGDIQTLDGLYADIRKEGQGLEKLLHAAEGKSDLYEKALAFATKGAAQFGALRSVVDQAEVLIADENWTLPRYDELVMALS
jgi:glutamine synthetase